MTQERRATEVAFEDAPPAWPATLTEDALRERFGIGRARPAGGSRPASRGVTWSPATAASRCHRPTAR